MIRAYTKKDYNAVTKLWQQAFGDSAEDIAACMRHFAPYLTVYTEENVLLGMFMRLPLEADGKKGDYIYAVATDKCARGRGIATALLDHAKASIQDGSKDFLALVPAKPSLFDFYENRGFTKGAPVLKKCHTNQGNAKANIAIKNITPARMYALRKAHFKNLAAWDEAMLSAIDDIYGGCFYELISEAGTGFCMAYKIGNKLIVSELCPGSIEENDAFSALDSYFNTDTVEAVLPDENGEAFAMFYPAEAAEMYFNIAIN